MCRGAVGGAVIASTSSVVLANIVRVRVWPYVVRVRVWPYVVQVRVWLDWVVVLLPPTHDSGVVPEWYQALADTMDVLPLTYYPLLGNFSVPPASSVLTPITPALTLVPLLVI